MHAITVIPGQSGTARLDQVPEPAPSEGSLLVETMLLGVCGTDIDILSGRYGTPPPGKTRLILGHESLGRVLEAPPGSGFTPGDLVVGIVRRPDPVPCPNCAAGEWDMCRNGRYTERGIKELDGYGSDHYRIDPSFTVKLAPELKNVGVLIEPTSVVAKAWEHIERIGHRAEWAPRKVVVTGAGPIGLLAALLGRQRGYDVHVVDRITEGPKPELVRALQATYHAAGERSALDAAVADADIVLECTGAVDPIAAILRQSRSNRIVCLTGVSSGGRTIPLDLGGLGRSVVLENEVIFGSVNANRRHYEQASQALAAADSAWLETLITRRVPLGRWAEALERQRYDVKPVIDFTAP